MKALRQLSLSSALPWILIVCGVIGLFCSFTLTMDKIEVLKNPNYRPICDLNPVLSCGSVMNSQQSEAFGFDNTIFGLAGFAVIITVGVVLLAGATLKRWFWHGLQWGLTFGVLFVHWLIYNSLYQINSLCPFCMAVWAIVIVMFVYVTLYNVGHRHINLPERFKPVYEFARRHHIDIIFVWYLIIFILILNRFWYFYGPKLGF
jgi:uncharacterized membrane protein